MTIAHDQAVNVELGHVYPAHAAPDLEPLVVPNGDGFVLALKEGYQLKTLPGPRVHRRSHVFDDLGTFAEYLNRHAVDRLGTEILLNDSRIVAALEPKNPIGDKLVCDLVQHPRFAAWAHVLTDDPNSSAGPDKLNQKEFFALLRARRDDLVDPMQAAQLLGSVQMLKLTNSGDRALELDERGYTRFMGGNERRNVAGEFPPFFSIRVPIFEGVHEVVDPEPGVETLLAAGRQVFGGELTYEIEILLWLEEVGGAVFFELQAPMLDLVVRQARRDAARYLQARLVAPLMVGLGVFMVEDHPAGTTRGPAED